MKKILLLILAIFISISNVSAKNTDTYKLPNNVIIKAKFYEDLYLSDAKLGQVVVARVLDNVVLNNQVVIPAGSYIKGKLTKPEKQRFIKRENLQIDFSQVFLPNEKTLEIGKNIYKVKVPAGIFLDDISFLSIGFHSNFLLPNAVSKEIEKTVAPDTDFDEKLFDKETILLLEKDKAFEIKVSTQNLINL